MNAVAKMLRELIFLYSQIDLRTSVKNEMYGSGESTGF